MEFAAMSFREKILWVTLLSGFAPYAWYFGSVGIALIGGSGPAALSMNRLVAAMLIGLIVMIIAVAVAAIRSRNEGTMIPDERELKIERRGFVTAYHMLCTGILGVIAAAWLGWSGVIIIHILALTFIAAELTRVAVEIHGLRRGY
jgi:hypothetical protein